MELDIKITSFDATIKAVIRNDNIKAFVDWIFATEIGVIKIHGGTIRLKPFGPNSTQILTFDGPAYGSHFTKVLFIDNPQFYKRLCDFTVNKYCQETGEKQYEVITEEVDINDLPI